MSFLPPEVVHMPGQGEFRQVITVFISLDPVNTQQDINRILQSGIDITQKYRGCLTRLDYGDKGCNLLIFWGTPIGLEDDVERALNFLLDLKLQTSPKQEK